MKGKENIEELFKESFKDFQSPVDPSVWQGVQSGLNAAATSASASSAVGSTAASTGKLSIIAKTAIGVVGAASISAGTYYFIADNTHEEVNNADKKELIVEKTESVIETHENELDENANNSTQNEIYIEENKQENKKEDLPIKNKEEAPVQKENTFSNNNSGLTNNEQTENTPEESNTTINTSKETSSAKNSEGSNEQIPSKPDEKERESEAPSLNVSIITQKNQFVELKADVENIDLIEWNMGDGYVVEGKVIEYYYDEPGEYIVQVTAGQITKEIKLTVFREAKITSLPNVFTPNNDGVNDYLYIESEGLEEFALVIFNGKQQVVYKTNDVDFQWDGTDMRTQNICESGQYYYIITATDSQGNSLNKHQVLTISK